MKWIHINRMMKDIENKYSPREYVFEFSSLNLFWLLRLIFWTAQELI